MVQDGQERRRKKYFNFMIILDFYNPARPMLLHSRNYFH